MSNAEPTAKPGPEHGDQSSGRHLSVVRNKPGVDITSLTDAEVADLAKFYASEGRLKGDRETFAARLQLAKAVGTDNVRQALEDFLNARKAALAAKNKARADRKAKKISEKAVKTTPDTAGEAVTVPEMIEDPELGNLAEAMDAATPAAVIATSETGTGLAAIADDMGAILQLWITEAAAEAGVPDQVDIDLWAITGERPGEPEQAMPAEEPAPPSEPSHQFTWMNKAGQPRRVKVYAGDGNYLRPPQEVARFQRTLLTLHRSKLPKVLASEEMITITQPLGDVIAVKRVNALYLLCRAALSRLKDLGIVKS